MFVNITSAVRKHNTNTNNISDWYCMFYCYTRQHTAKLQALHQNHTFFTRNERPAFVKLLEVSTPTNSTE